MVDAYQGKGDMTDQPPVAGRSPAKRSEDDQPTLVLPLANIMETQHLPAAEVQIEAETPNENAPAAETRTSRLKKFFTSTPTRKAASIAGAILLAAFSGIAGAVSPSLFSHAPNKSEGATQHIFYVPWSGAGGLSEGIHVANSVSGYCWTTSSISLRYDAYRCLISNKFIYDPCFASYTGTSVACPMPSPTDIIMIKLDRPLPTAKRSPSATQTTPASTVWLVVLADGDRCYAIYAMANAPGGMSLTYTCKDGDLYGNINGGSPIWTIWEQKTGAADMTLAPIAQAYS
jgi:hypothetical protein